MLVDNIYIGFVNNIFNLIIRTEHDSYLMYIVSNIAVENLDCSVDFINLAVMVNAHMYGIRCHTMDVCTRRDHLSYKRM